MSLVTVRNLIFGRPKRHLPAGAEPGALESQDALSTAHPSETQPLLGGGGAGGKGREPRPSISSSSSSTFPGEENENEPENDKKSNRGFRIHARIISDATIGLADGLTVPFALTAGLSALGETKIVVYGGLAELIAGALSMGLGGYLGAKSEAYVNDLSFKTPYFSRLSGDDADKILSPTEPRTARHAQNVPNSPKRIRPTQLPPHYAPSWPARQPRRSPRKPSKP